MSGMMQMMMGMKGGGSGKGDWDMWGKGKGKSMGKDKDRATSTGESYMGVIKSFNELNNYGFIICEETKAKYGGDVFAPGKELADHHVGTQVLFELGLSHSGKPQAMNVTAMGMEEPLAKKLKMEDDKKAAFAAYRKSIEALPKPGKRHY
eukprot:gnl/TRDRNA2_/TRDRNA2_167974_c0_seq11.p1 gnl/TRDRNA2_/TRDRNA2_167974_c0~~gnl/TRDRNA2_/TRDRNA2_167974_c0_seq11.p1  ORF type:complete len:166 (+),score=49.37 gnl/TRDRNA2_/TRDRNA2_167974_c0_seq11:51-500(+)